MWKTAKDAVQGRRHKQRNVPCQDYTSTYSDDEITIIALADGAGSCEHSDLGAQVAVDTAIKVIKTSFDNIVGSEDVYDAKRMILGPVTQALMEKATSHSVDYDSLSSTLLVAAVKGDSYLLFHAGDGVIGYVKDDSPLIASFPFNGEFANETDFCTTSTIYETSKIYKGNAEKIKAFIIFSDGVEATFYSYQTKSLRQDIMQIPRWTALFSQDTSSQDLHEALEEYISHNTGDDCSIAVMVRNEYAAEAFSQLSREDLDQLFSIKEGRNSREWVKRMKRRTKFLIEAGKPSGCNTKMACRILGCSPKYLKKKIQGLIDAGVIANHNGVYRTLQ